MSNLKKQGTTAFIWDILGRFFSQGSGIIFTIFLARLLEPSDFGLIAIAMVIIGIAGIFTDIGLGGALIQRRRLHPVHFSSVFSFNIFMGICLMLITYFLSSYIAEFYNDKNLVNIIQILSFIFILNSLGGVHIIILRKELNFKVLTLIGIVSTILSGIIGVFLAFNNYGVFSLVYQQLLFSIVSFILVLSYSKWKIKFNFSFKALKQLWAYGFRMFLSGFLENVFTRIDYIIIGKIFNITILGYFQRAKSLDLLIINYTSASLMSVLFPLLSKIQNDIVRFRRVVLKGFGILNFVVFGLIGVFYINAYEIIIILFGVKWEQSVSYFEILVLSSFAYPLSSLLVNILSSRGNSKDFLKLEIIKKFYFIRYIRKWN